MIPLKWWLPNSENAQANRISSKTMSAIWIIIICNDVEAKLSSIKTVYDSINNGSLFVKTDYKKLIDLADVNTKKKLMASKISAIDETHRLFHLKITGFYSLRLIKKFHSLFLCIIDALTLLCSIFSSLHQNLEINNFS